jgi:adenosylcobinamide-phosphate synthase
VLVFGTTWGIAWAIGQLPEPVVILLMALLLKPTFAFRMLVSEVIAIESALQQDLNQGRQRLAYIVSRKTENLTAIEVRESALESISENLSDSVIAPLFWFLIFGLPGAYLYRFVNTADSMWGYRDERYEQWGKVAAKVDDLMNLIPSRITGLWLLYFPNMGWLKVSLTKGDLGESPVMQFTDRPRLIQLRYEADKTPSPNSGWSMAAFALRLGVRLGKPGVYVLNEKAADVDADTAEMGIAWITYAGWVLALLLALARLLQFELAGWLYG